MIRTMEIRTMEILRIRHGVLRALDILQGVIRRPHQRTFLGSRIASWADVHLHLKKKERACLGEGGAETEQESEGERVRDSERARARERERQREKERKRDMYRWCVCVRERENLSSTRVRFVVVKHPSSALPEIPRRHYF